MKIDLALHFNEKTRDTISGRDAGLAVMMQYRAFVNWENGTSGIEIVIPDHIRVITPSFFVGLLGRLLPTNISHEQATILVQLRGGTASIQSMLDTALKTIVSEAKPEPPSSLTPYVVALLIGVALGMIVISL